MKREKITLGFFIVVLLALFLELFLGLIIYGKKNLSGRFCTPSRYCFFSVMLSISHVSGDLLFPASINSK